MILTKKNLLAISLFIMMTILVACGGQDESSPENETNTSESSEKTTQESTELTLTDAMGHEVTVPANPEKVLASYLEDYLVALDVTPVAQWSVQNGIQDYLQEELKEVPTIDSTLPLEAVTSFTPDLILMDSASQVEGTAYDQYSKIAPTYVVGESNNNDWREELLTVGEVLNKKDKAQEVLDEYEQKAEAAKANIQEAVGSESAAAIWLVNNSFFVVGDAVSSGAVLYGDLGLTTPNVVKEISGTATGNWSPISLEKLAELDADHLFLINSDKANGSEMLKDPLWQNIPAVKNNQVYEFESNTSWLYSGPIANSQIIDDVVESLVK
jgi:iron complex transport system substrate-binding protein